MREQMIGEQVADSESEQADAERGFRCDVSKAWSHRQQGPAEAEAEQSDADHHVHEDRVYAEREYAKLDDLCGQRDHRQAEQCDGRERISAAGVARARRAGRWSAGCGHGVETMADPSSGANNPPA